MRCAILARSSNVCKPAWRSLSKRDARPLAVIRAAAPVRRTISECIALAEAHEKETGQAPVLDPDFADDVEGIVRNRKPWKPPVWG